MAMMVYSTWYHTIRCCCVISRILIFEWGSYVSTDMQLEYSIASADREDYPRSVPGSTQIFTAIKKSPVYAVPWFISYLCFTISIRAITSWKRAKNFCAKDEDAVIIVTHLFKKFCSESIKYFTILSRLRQKYLELLNRTLLGWLFTKKYYELLITCLIPDKIGFIYLFRFYIGGFFQLFVFVREHIWYKDLIMGFSWDLNLCLNCQPEWVQVSLTRLCAIYVFWRKQQAGNILVCKNEINKSILKKIQISSWTYSSWNISFLLWTNSNIYIYIYIY